MVAKVKEKPPKVNALAFAEEKEGMKQATKKNCVKMREHNQCTFKTNVDVNKDLNEPEPPTNNVVELDAEACRLVKG
jgi:hypothetical protein